VDERAQYTTSLGLAKRALEYIVRYGTPLTPHAYELFYTVCTGQNAALNKALAEIISEKRKLSASDAEKLFEQFLSSEPSSEKIKTIGSKMSSEMATVLSLLDTATSSANTYQATLQNAEERLNNSSSEQNMSEMIRTLNAATRTMASTNSEVTANLEMTRAQVEQLEDCLKLAREESSRDALTGLVNRRRFDLVLDETLLTSNSSGKPASLLVIDIDHFKAFNDTYGHVAGDSTLRYVASCIKSNIKGQDSAARYGGEEFTIILPNTTIEHAMGLAERIRHLINARHLVKKATGEDMGRVSVSIGVTQNEDGDTSESFLHRADMCMYAAKNAGRNQVRDTPAPQAQQEMTTDAA
jgi:diguanylate cyclase